MKIRLYCLSLLKRKLNGVFSWEATFQHTDGDGKLISPNVTSANFPLHFVSEDRPSFDSGDFVDFTLEGVKAVAPPPNA